MRTAAFVGGAGICCVESEIAGVGGDSDSPLSERSSALLWGRCSGTDSLPSGHFDEESASRGRSSCYQSTTWAPNGCSTTTVDMLDVVEVAPGIHRLGRKRHSFYLIAEAGKVTVVDAVVVTHAHTHHIGFAGAAAERGIPVEVLEAEAAFAMDRSAGSQVDMTDLPLWKPRVILFLTEMVRAGAHNRVAVPGSRLWTTVRCSTCPAAPRRGDAGSHRRARLLLAGRSSRALLGRCARCARPHRRNSGPAAPSRRVP